MLKLIEKQIIAYIMNVVKCLSRLFVIIGIFLLIAKPVQIPILLDAVICVILLLVCMCTLGSLLGDVAPRIEIVRFFYLYFLLSNKSNVEPNSTIARTLLNICSHIGFYVMGIAFQYKGVFINGSSWVFFLVPAILTTIVLIIANSNRGYSYIFKDYFTRVHNI